MGLRKHTAPCPNCFADLVPPSRPLHPRIDCFSRAFEALSMSTCTFQARLSDLIVSDLNASPAQKGLFTDIRLNYRSGSRRYLVEHAWRERAIATCRVTNLYNQIDCIANCKDFTAVRGRCVCVTSTGNSRSIFVHQRPRLMILEDCNRAFEHERQQH